MGEKLSLGNGALCPHTAEVAQGVSWAVASGRVPYCVTHHFLGVRMKSLTLAFHFHTSPLPGGPGAWVICCFFKLAPHPRTVCQEGPLFMRIPHWLQLTLRCTILGLCPELLLFFVKVPSSPPYLFLPSLNPALSLSLILLSEESLRGGQGRGEEAHQGNRKGLLNLVAKAGLCPGLREEAGRPLSPGRGGGRYSQPGGAEYDG